MTVPSRIIRVPSRSATAKSRCLNAPLIRVIARFLHAPFRAALNRIPEYFLALTYSQLEIQLPGIFLLILERCVIIFFFLFLPYKVQM